MKFKYLLLLPLLATTACKKNTAYLKIICPTGAPALAFYKYVEDSNFETNSDASNIKAMMSLGSYDVVILPTNVGVQLISKENPLPYQIAATLTFGNFYIAATGNDDNNVMDNTDNIIVFAPGAVGDKIFHYVYGNEFDENISYVNDVSTASKILAAGINLTNENEPVDYVFIAEPALYTVLHNEKAPTYGKACIYANMQEEYRKKANNLDIYQASIFVKTDADHNDIDNFLNSLKKDIEEAIETPSLFNEYLSKSDAAPASYGVSGVNAELVTRNNNGMGLGFKKAFDNKQGIDAFLRMFNINETKTEIYYK